MADQPTAQVYSRRHGPAGEVQLHRIGMAVGGQAWPQHVRRLGVKPPGIAWQRPRDGRAAAGSPDRLGTLQRASAAVCRSAPPWPDRPASGICRTANPWIGRTDPAFALFEG